MYLQHEMLMFSSRKRDRKGIRFCAIFAQNLCSSFPATKVETAFRLAGFPATLENQPD